MGKEIEEFVRSAQQHLADVGVRSAETFDNLGDQMKLLLSIRDTLDRFVPAVFLRSVADLIEAQEAPSAASPLKAADRRRLRRRAKEYVRPGVDVGDMRDALRRIEEQRRKWRAIDTDRRTAPPEIPVGLDEDFVRWRTYGTQLRALDQTPGREGERPLRSVPLAELSEAIAHHG